MSASIYVYWPGASADEQGAHPGFGNDAHAYADWLSSVSTSGWLRFRLSLKNMLPLLSVYPVNTPDKQIVWTTPADLRKAAENLRNEMLKSTSFAVKLAQFYLKGPGVNPPQMELAQDLADVAAIADYAAGLNAKRVTLTVGW